MSLISFHRLLIGAGILFCAGFGAWELNAYLKGGGTSALLLSVAFGIAGVALGYYLRNLRRFLNLPEDGSSEPR